VRNTFADTIYEAGRNDKRVAIVVADISPAGSMQKFRDEFPERFVNTGVSEQIMIGLCAGMALRGMRPFAYTIATFTFYRPFEFVRDDLCYQNLPVTVVGIGGGVAYSTLGGTHHAQEDVVLASALPNMTVLAPCDPAECREASLWCTTQERGPVYLRLGKAGEPDLTSRAVDPFVFGKLRYLRRGSDVCILAYGPITKMAADLAAKFEAKGESVSLVSVHTLKPLDTEGLVQALASHRRVVVIEEAAPYALGLRVKALAWESQARCRIDTFALQDAFIHTYGAPAELLAAHGLDLGAIAAKLGLS
jgi:transketolase